MQTLHFHRIKKVTKIMLRHSAKQKTVVVSRERKFWYLRISTQSPSKAKKPPKLELGREKLRFVKFSTSNFSNKMLVYLLKILSIIESILCQKRSEFVRVSTATSVVAFVQYCIQTKEMN